MEPRLIRRTPLCILGVVTQVRRGSETPQLFAGIWQQFESRRPEIEPLAAGKGYFGVQFPTGEQDVTDYLAGMAVPAETQTLEGLEKRTVPGGRFAVFECPVEGVGETYRYIFGSWLPDSGARFNPTAPVFEEYPEDTSERAVWIHVPLLQDA